MISRRGLEWLFIVGLLAGPAGVCWGQSTANAAQTANPIAKAGYKLEARLLKQAEISHQFVSDVNRGHLVVEVTLEPTAGAIDIHRTDFQLTVSGDTERIAAAEPASVAAYLQKTAPAYRDVTVTPEVGVIYRAGRPQPDPTFDPNYPIDRASRRVTIRTGTDIQFGNQTGGLTDEDRKVMETELSDKELSEGKTNRRVVGYLYFRVDHPQKVDRISLDYSPPGGTETTIRLRGK